jgi:2,3-bisphosphoglycerate-independent phosphoglycerate mutase
MGKCAFVLVDGIGDVSVPLIGSGTPLQLADTPVLDAIASARTLRAVCLAASVISLFT